MGKIFDIDGPVMRFFAKIGDLILINLLFLICSIPVVTAGASAVSMYTLTMRLVRREERTRTVRSFFAAFRENFRRATAIWGIFLGVGLVLAVNYWLMTFNPDIYPVLMRVLIFCLTFIYVMCLTWVFPMYARFENKVTDTVRNSLAMGISYIGVTVPAMGLTVLPAILLYYKTAFFLKTAVFWLFIGFALTSYLKSFLFVRVFGKFEDG